MNRAQRRNFITNAKKKGVSKDVAKTYISIMDDAGGASSFQQEVADGQMVKINTSKIKSRKTYADMNDRYKQFIEESADEVFVAHIVMPNIVSLGGVPWLFWSGDLIKTKEQS